MAGEQHAAKQNLITTGWARQRGLCSQPPQLKRQQLFLRLWTPSHSSRTTVDLPKPSGMAAAAPGDTAAAAAAADGDSRELVVPPPPRPGVLHMCVEYPGYVADEERVLETLGGTAGIARQLQVWIAEGRSELRRAACSAGALLACCGRFPSVAYTCLSADSGAKSLHCRRTPGSWRCGCAPATTTATPCTECVSPAAACCSSSPGLLLLPTAAPGPAAAAAVATAVGQPRWWPRCPTRTASTRQQTTSTSPTTADQWRSRVSVHDGRVETLVMG